MLQSCWWLVVFVLGDVVVTMLLFYLFFRAREDGAAEGAAEAAAAAALERWALEKSERGFETMIDSKLSLNEMLRARLPDVRMCEVFIQTDRGVIVCHVVMDFHRRALRKKKPGCWHSWRAMRPAELRRLLD